MERLIVTCPNCHHQLSIRNENGIMEKMLTCPHCRHRARVSVYLQQCFGSVNNVTDDEPTQIASSEFDLTVGSLFHGRNEYSLHKGRNTIGRKARTSQAEVQITNDDRYMSRQHAVITIMQGAHSLEHRLQPTNPKNPIKVNGTLLSNTDIVILSWGDKLTFGRTELFFDKPQSADEQTIIE